MDNNRRKMCIGINSTHSTIIYSDQSGCGETPIRVELKVAARRMDFSSYFTFSPMNLQMEIGSESDLNVETRI